MILNKYYVYGLRDPIGDQMFYIGKGCGKRAWSHLNEDPRRVYNGFKHNKIKSIRSKGYEPVVEILFSGLSNDLAHEVEAELIKYHGRRGHDPNGTLTNITVDCRPPVRTTPHSEQTKQRMSDASKGKKKSPAHCRSIGDAKKGDKHPNWGKQLSEERREKIRISNLGQKRSLQARRNVADAHSVNYELVDPHGDTFWVNSQTLNVLCDRSKLNRGSITNYCKPGMKYKGWTIRRV